MKKLKLILLIIIVISCVGCSNNKISDEEIREVESILNN